MTDLELNEQNPRTLRIVKPNLGNPLVLEIDPGLKKRKFIVKLLVVSDLTNSRLVEDKIKNNIKLIPILDYKLELKFLLDKKKTSRKGETERNQKS